MKKYLPIIVFYLISACTPVATPETSPLLEPALLVQEENNYAPKPEDAGWQKAGVVINSVNLAEDPSTGRALVLFNGSMPTPCHELRIEVSYPSFDSEVFIKVYSVLKPSLVCENVLRQFDAQIKLGVYSAGVYSVWVNGLQIGDFVSY